MHDRPEQTVSDNPLRNLTADEFMALGENAVVYVRQIDGRTLSSIGGEGEFAIDEEFQIVVSADGSPLLVADSEEAVEDWLAERNFGVVTVH
jgi:hypothetical protein